MGTGVGTLPVHLAAGTLLRAVVHIADAVLPQCWDGARLLLTPQQLPAALRAAPSATAAAGAPGGPGAQLAAGRAGLGAALSCLLHPAGHAGHPAGVRLTGAMPGGAATATAARAGAPGGPGPIGWARQRWAHHGAILTGAVVALNGGLLSRPQLLGAVVPAQPAAALCRGHAQPILQQLSLWAAAPWLAAPLHALHVLPEVGAGAGAAVGAGGGEYPSLLLTVLPWAHGCVAALALGLCPLALPAACQALEVAVPQAETPTAGLLAGPPRPPGAPEAQLLADVGVWAEPLLLQLS